MNSFLRGLFSLLLLICLISKANAQDTTKKPNFIFIMLDDLDRVTTAPFYNQVLPKTMTLKNEGVYFQNAFVATALCCPSRAAIVSGKYGHNTNVLTNGGPYGGWEQFRDDEPCAMPKHLFDAGYRTAIFGKYMNGYSYHAFDDQPLPPPYGWTDGALIVDKNMKAYRAYDYHMFNWTDGNPVSSRVWTSARTMIDFHGSAPEDYSTDVIYNKTIQFLEKTKRENDQQPFMAFVAPTCPHFPIPPAPRHHEIARRWDPSSFPRNRPNFFNDLGAMGGNANGFPNDKPLWLRTTWNRRHKLLNGNGGRFLIRKGGEEFDDEMDNLETEPGRSWLETDWHNRMGSLYACDELVDGIVRWLKANGEWDNTVLFFTSDNGYNLGAHSLGQKLAPYEESIRVPLLVAGGAATGIRQGVQTNQWALNIDFAPTILDLAGAGVPPDMDGNSLKSILQNPGTAEAETIRRSFLIEYHGPGMANGYLSNFPLYHVRWAPVAFLDMPTYHGIRVNRPIEVNGRVEHHDFLYVQWERIPEDMIFRRRIRTGRRMLARRIERHRPLAYRRYEDSLERDEELYDITVDPWQLDNLMYFQPDKYLDFAQNLKADLVQIHECHGQHGSQSCVEASLR